MSLIGKALTKIPTTIFGKNDFIRKLAFELRYKLEKDPWKYKKYDYAVFTDSKLREELSKIKDKYNSALEIGCASGENMDRLKQMCSSVTATDISKTAIDQANKKFKSDGLSFQQLDIAKNKLDQKFDLILAREVLYYINLKCVKKAVSNIKDMMSQDSIFVRCEISNCKGSSKEFDRECEKDFSVLKVLDCAYSKDTNCSIKFYKLK